MYLSQKNLILSGKFFFDFQMGYPFSSHTPNDLFFEPPSPPLPPCTHMCAFREPPFCVRDSINWIPSLSVLTLLVCHNFHIMISPGTS